MNDWLTIIGFLVGIVSLVYAVITNREKAKLEKVIKMRLLNIEESVEDLEKNTALAHTNIDTARQSINDLKHSKGMKEILDRIVWAEADITAAHRLSKRLKRDIESLDDGLFLERKKQGNKQAENKDESA
jgi:hypothetical protein